MVSQSIQIIGYYSLVTSPHLIVYFEGQLSGVLVENKSFTLTQNLHVSSSLITG